MSAFKKGFAVLAIGNLLGKFVALAREVIFAAAFGAGNVASGFRVAQTASMVPANLIAGDLLSAAFAPTYALEAKRNPARASAQLWGYSVWVSLVLGVAAAGVYFSRSALVVWMVPGATASVQSQGAEFLGIMSVTIPLYGLSAIMSYALGAHGVYSATSVRPLIQSVGLLAGTALAISTGWVPWLAVGLVVAWVIYTALCAFLLAQRGLLDTTTWRELFDGWRFVADGAKRIAPLFFLPVALQLSIVLERLFSSLGDDGLIAAVDYARTISDSVMSLIAVPLGILGLTQLSALSAAQYRTTVSKMSSFVVSLMLPVSAVLTISALPIVQAIYVRGRFGDEAAELTSGVLVGLCVGLVFQVLGYSLSRALTAVSRNKAVLMITLAALVAQGLVQGLGIASFGPIAIGLGPSAFGLVLTVGCALSLGLINGIVRQCLAAVPAILVSVAVLLLDVPFTGGLIIAVVAWAINILSFGVLRSPLTDQLMPLIRSLASRLRRGRR
jgi:putative peptidoglycan lipid II flippase